MVTHSHHVRANLSGEQEVSGFGSGDESDNGDNWMVECVGDHAYINGKQYWTRNRKVQLKHVSTQAYLSVSSSFVYTDQNCPHCPIVGHREAFTKTGGSSTKKGNTLFQVEDAVHLYQ